MADTTSTATSAKAAPDATTSDAATPETASVQALSSAAGTLPVRRRALLFERRVLTFGALAVTLAVLAAFWYLGAAWVNGQALCAVLAVMFVWLVAGSTLRHRFRFGLRTLFVMMTIAAVLFALVGKRWYDIQGRRRAIAALEPMGVSVRYSVRREGDWFRTDEGWLLPSWLIDVLGEDFFADPFAISLSQSQIDNQVLAATDLAGYPYVAVCLCNLDDDGMAALAGLVDLESLQINGTRISDAGLAHLSGCVNLTFLDLSNDNVSDTGLEHLAGLAKLQRLDLEGTRVTGVGLQHLRGSGLTMLNLSAAPVTTAGLAEIGRLPALVSLRLDSTGITDADLAQLDRLTNLQYLRLINTNVGDAGLAHLEDLRNLEALDLGGTLVTADGLAHLAGMNQLSSLDLERCRISDAGLTHLEHVASLRQLNLEGTNVTAAGVARLREARPGCEIRWTQPTPSTSAP
ncbi:MAG: hypothetical protein KDA63_12555 [Planctomycetales bacterium]|nr:hypothetical protein [Planctomycetales bacterium]